MAEKELYYGKKTRQNSWMYIVCLILSFMWLSLYPTLTALVDTPDVGYGNILNSSLMTVFATSVVTEAVISWIIFELFFWIYRYILSFKIYSFVVPLDSFKAETRLYFIIRNVFLGVVYNLCFLFPYLFAFKTLFDLLVTLVVLMFYAKHLNAVYGESIVGHFVFKNFCYPIFIYEGIEILIAIWTVLVWKN